ncbi:hypothetical protein PENTCL1PPCAC_15240, partial [Pristionchus entomophagus]
FLLRNAIRREWLRDVRGDDDVCAFFSTTRTIVIDELHDDGKGFIEKGKGFESTEESSATPTSPFPKGVCGLVNLVSTGFMNAGLQCILNVPELVEYFISDRYQSDINETNPLGTAVRISLIILFSSKISHNHKMLYLESSTMVFSIGKFVPLFSGFHRQDAQELLAALLDGLHEDLNRIKTKPYIEETDPLKGMEQKEIADEAWSNYRKRNDSVIVDNLHGQLRRTLVCPQCGKISIKFDPFCFLSVPVPTRE